jgi:hypothetical protein
MNELDFAATNLKELANKLLAETINEIQLPFSIVIEM